VGDWPSSKASIVLAALLRLGWRVARQTGSHKVLTREGCANFVFAFHERVEFGPKMLARIAKHTGLKPSDL
jgi:predicted RNA binding protein YcfA (HicA-like mRNA interferase family)